MTALAKAPEHWTRTTVGDVADVRGGIQKQPSRRPNDNPAPFLRVANVQRNALDLTDIHRIELQDGELERYQLHPGDLLVVEGNGSLAHIGRSAVWRGEIEGCVHQNHLIRVRPGEEVLADFLNYYWNSPIAVQGIQAVAQTTSGLYTLSIAKVSAVPIAVPPLDEQKRIVAEIERLLARHSHVRLQLGSARNRADLQRRLVLEHAIRGAGLTLSGGDAVAELSQVTSELDPAPRKTDGQPVPAWLPDGWTWVPVRSAVGDDGLVSDGDWVETKDQDPTGEVRLLQLSDIGVGEFRDRSDRHVNTETAERLGVTDVQRGDVLVARLGDPPGDATVVPDLGQRAITAVDVCIVRPVDGAISPPWLEACFNSPSFRAAVVRYQSGTTRKRITRLKLQELKLPVPPLADQETLVDWLRTQTLRLDRLERQLDSAITRCDTLRRSILKAAFEGRL